MAVFKPGNRCVPGFIKLILCKCLCVFVSLSPGLLLTSGMIWTPYDWLNNFYTVYVAAVVGIVRRCGLSTDINVHHENQPNKCKIALYKLSIHFIKAFKRSSFRYI